MTAILPCPFLMTLARDTQQIESERLVLRRIGPGDLEFLTLLHADPEVALYLPPARPRTPQESVVWLQSVLMTYEQFGLGPLAVLRKSDGRLIGRCGLSYLAVEARPAGTLPRGWYHPAEVPPGADTILERELGYTFDRSSWGQGYASEAARCVFDYARNTLKLPRVVSLIHPDNLRSLRVVERFGVLREDVLEVKARPFIRFAWPIPA